MHADEYGRSHLDEILPDNNYEPGENTLSLPWADAYTTN